MNVSVVKSQPTWLNTETNGKKLLDEVKTKI